MPFYYLFLRHQQLLKSRYKGASSTIVVTGPSTNMHINAFYPAPDITHRELVLCTHPETKNVVWVAYIIFIHWKGMRRAYQGEYASLGLLLLAYLSTFHGVLFDDEIMATTGTLVHILWQISWGADLTTLRLHLDSTMHSTMLSMTDPT